MNVGLGLVTEQLALGIDADFHCPAVLVRPAEPGQTKLAGLILSHNDRGCAASAKIAEAAKQLATAGYWVIVPEHASANPRSLQSLADAGKLILPTVRIGHRPDARRVGHH